VQENCGREKRKLHGPVLGLCLISPTTDGLADCNGGFVPAERALASPQETTGRCPVAGRCHRPQTQTHARPGDKNRQFGREREDKQARERKGEKAGKRRCGAARKRRRTVRARSGSERVQPQ
jgi:hypothetical protein